MQQYTIKVPSGWMPIYCDQHKWGHHRWIDEQGIVICKRCRVPFGSIRRAWGGKCNANNRASFATGNGSIARVCERSRNLGTLRS